MIRSPLPSVRRVAAVVCAAVLLGPLAACGKKGPPLEPLRLAPAQPAEPTLARVGSDVVIQFTLPVQNVGGTGAIDLERVEVYAVTVAPGAEIPAAREFLVRRNLIATIPVKPLPEEGQEEKQTPPAQPPAAVKDDRPSPGDRVTFTERLTAKEMTPTVPPKVVPPPRSGSEAAAAAAATPPAPPDLVFPTRVYIVRGVSRHDHPGAPGARLSLPMVDAPAPPVDLKAVVGETAVSLEWIPPPVALDPVLETTARQTVALTSDWITRISAQNDLPRKPAPKTATTILRPEVAAMRVLPGVLVPLSPPVGARFNLYEVVEGKPAVAPLNPSPLTTPTFALGKPEWGRERCFAVRTVRRYGRVSIESAEAAQHCVTPIDTFPPAAPTGLRAVASPGSMSLIWSANRETDLAGYVVLRGEVPGDKLQALTTAPIRETTFTDTTVKPNVRYAYAIVAVDNADKPNMSAQSARVEETAR